MNYNFDILDYMDDMYKYNNKHIQLINSSLSKRHYSSQIQ